MIIEDNTRICEVGGEWSVHSGGEGAAASLCLLCHLTTRATSTSRGLSVSAYRCFAEGAPCKTSPSDAAENLEVFDIVMGALES